MYVCKYAWEYSVLKCNRTLAFFQFIVSFKQKILVLYWPKRRSIHPVLYNKVLTLGYLYFGNIQLTLTTNIHLLLLKYLHKFETSSNEMFMQLKWYLCFVFEINSLIFHYFHNILYYILNTPNLVSICLVFFVLHCKQFCVCLYITKCFQKFSK